MEDKKSEDLKKIKDAYKPKLWLPIYVTIVCLGPYGHLWLAIIDENYEGLATTAILTGISLIGLGVTWTRYFTNLFKYQDEASDYLREPDNYRW